MNVDTFRLCLCATICVALVVSAHQNESAWYVRRIKELLKNIVHSVVIRFYLQSHWLKSPNQNEWNCQRTQTATQRETKPNTDQTKWVENGKCIWAYYEVYEAKTKTMWSSDLQLSTIRTYKNELIHNRITSTIEHCIDVYEYIWWLAMVRCSPNHELIFDLTENLIYGILNAYIGRCCTTSFDELQCQIRISLYIVSAYISQCRCVWNQRQNNQFLAEEAVHSTTLTHTKNTSPRSSRRLRWLHWLRTSAVSLFSFPFCHDVTQKWCNTFANLLST